MTQFGGPPVGYDIQFQQCIIFYNLVNNWLIPMNRKNIRIVVLGDESVGKSWLIHTIYSEVSSNVEKTLKKVILPPEMCFYSRDVFTELVDTSVEMDIGPEIRNSDLALLVYDVSDPETIARIDGEWLPRINTINPKIPIILVGNKMDKKQLEFEGEEEYTKIKDILKKVTKRFKNVQMGIECSAFYDRNVKSVLNCAQRAVLYPLSPLYNLEEKRITQNFKKALARIFRILDQDFDGRLHDSELNALQERVFQSQLNTEDIKAIKQVILRELEVEQHDYIQLKGFIALQKKVIQMLKIQICWSILRYFKYNDELRINVNTEHYTLQQRMGQSVELSSEAIFSLSRKSSQIEGDEQQGKQSQAILDTIFYSCPQVSLPEFRNKNCVENQQKFLTLWSLYAFLDYNRCYEDLLYLGYQHSIDQAYNRRRSKKQFHDFQRMKDNKVFSVLIIETDSCSRYINALFLDAQTIKVTDSDQRTLFTYQRTPKLFTNQNIAKTFLLFKVEQENLSQFFENKETQFSKTIDLVVEFEGRKYEKEDMNVSLIPDYMLYKKVTTKEAEQILHTNQFPKLDLTSMPIKYDEKGYEPFFSQIIYKTLQNIEEGLSQQKIQSLKQQNSLKKNKLIISVASAAIAGLLIGSFIFQKLKPKFWK